MDYEIVLRTMQPYISVKSLGHEAHNVMLLLQTIFIVTQQCHSIYSVNTHLCFQMYTPLLQLPTPLFQLFLLLYQQPSVSIRAGNLVLSR